MSNYKSETSFFKSRKNILKSGGAQILDSQDSEPESENEEEGSEIKAKFPFVKVIDSRNPDQTTMRVSVKTKEDFEDVKKLHLKPESSGKYYNKYAQNQELRSKTKAKFTESQQV